MIFHDRRQRGRLDLEAVEMAVRSAMHQAGAAALTELLQYQAPEPDQRTLACACGQKAQYRELRAKPILTAVGEAELRRPYYLCADCHQGQFPIDVELDVEKTEFSPGVRRMMARVGSEGSSFDCGREQLHLLAGLEVTTKAVERIAEQIGADIAAGEQAEIHKALQLRLPVVGGPSIPVMYVEMDATGVPVVRKETEGRIGKEGERARTREVKIGCVFTQTRVDEEGWPVRDEDSTTYVAAIEPASEFSRRLYTEADRRGWDRARLKVVLGDGAIWIWNIADEHFPGATQIVDLCHARQHLWNQAAKLHPTDEPAKRRWVMIHQVLLDGGEIEKLVAALRLLAENNTPLAEPLHTEAEYFERNTERMRYPKFRAAGLFVGTGVIEAACKTVIGTRLKRSGMFWTVRGANAIIALRCHYLSGRFEDYWEARRA